MGGMLSILNPSHPDTAYTRVPLNKIYSGFVISIFLADIESYRYGEHEKIFFETIPGVIFATRTLLLKNYFK